MLPSTKYQRADEVPTAMGRIAFANHLRGLAAAIVVIGHLVGVYWASRDLVASATATPPLTGPTSALFDLVAHEWFNCGAFGVAVFFLISGLVIPISLDHYDSGTFLVARVLRIYPTYLAGFALLMAVIAINSLVWKQPFPARWSDTLSNALLANDFAVVPDLSLVSWTLCVEIKFYVLAAIFAQNIRFGSVSTLFAVGLFSLLINTFGTAPELVNITREWPYVYRAALLDAPYLVFMLIGILFNYHLRRLISSLTLTFSVAGLFMIFVATWKSSPFVAQFPFITINYVYALLLFTACYFFRQQTRASVALDFLAKISYPLYIIHAIVGYSLLKYLMIMLGMPFSLSLLITLLLLVVGATVLHVTVERWSIILAKRSLRRRVA